MQTLRLYSSTFKQENIMFTFTIQKLLKLKIGLAVLWAIFALILLLISNTNFLTQEIIFILDLSQSMNTQDITLDQKLDSRLNWAKQIIANSIKKYDWQYSRWLIIFNNQSQVHVPPTFDSEHLLSALESINTSSLNSWWSDITQAISLYQNISENKNNLWILITDWWSDNLDEKILQSNTQTIYTIWIWSTQGGVVRSSNWSIVKDTNWANKTSTLNISNLKKISNINSNSYKVFSDIKNDDYIQIKSQKNTSIANTTKTILTWLLIFSRIAIL